VFLTFANILVVLGFRKAILKKQGKARS